MYRVYCDGQLIYHSNIENLKIFNPSVELELNKTGSFNFTVYPDHPRYRMINKMKSIITVFQDNYMLFRGRALDEEIGWYNQKTIICEGEIAFLLDSIIRPYSFSGTIAGFLADVVQKHNNSVEAEKRFVVGNVTVTGTVNYESADYLTAKETIEKGLIEQFGGYLSTRHVDNVTYLDYLADFNLLAPQSIQFGKNLLDLKKIRKGADIATYVIPLGAQDETGKRLTIESVNSGADFLSDTAGIAKFGYIFKTVIFEDITDPTQLKLKGQAYLADAVNQWETIELTAADLATVDSDITSFHLGTQVNVVSVPHGIEQRFLVSKLSIRLLEPAANMLTLGKTIPTFSEAVIFPKGDPGKPGSPGKDGINGKDGVNGKDGINGKDGVGVASITEQYYLSTSATALSGGSWSGTVPTWVDGRFMWTRSVIQYTNGTTVNTDAKCVTGAKGSTGAAGSQGAAGKDGISITKVDVMYYQSTSATTLSGGSWQTTAPAWVNGRFFWEKTVVTYSDGTTEESNPACITGQQGQTGAAGKDGVGVASITEQYYLSTSATTQTGGSWADTVPTWADGKFMWTRSVIAYTNGTSVNTNPKCVTGAKGSTGSAGSPGAAGKDGISITKVDVMYYQSTSATSLAGGSWVTTAPAWVNGRFFWEKTVVSYSDGSTEESNPVCITGQQGQTGATGSQGAAGKDGVGVASITEQYYLSTSATTQSGGTWSDTVPTWVDGRFMWTRSVIAYTSGATVTTNPKCVTGAKGSTGAAGSAGAAGKDGVSITKVDVMYYQSTSSTSLAGGSWVTTAPAWVNGRFFWEKTVVTYSNGTTAESNPVCITGQQGQTGATGATGATGSPGANGKDGVGVTSIAEQYYLSTSATAQSGGSWSGTVPTWVDGRYMWTRSVITYTNGTTVTTSPKCVTGAKGSTGSTGSAGANGKDGVSITKVDVMYYQSTSSTALSGGSWQTTAPAWVNGRYFWEKTVVTYSNGTTAESNPVCITGQQGQTGATGATGATGSPGANGKDGKDAAIQSLTAPTDTSYLWLDISLDPPLLKRYNSEVAAWVVVNDTTDIVYNLEQNLKADIIQTEQNIQMTVSETVYLKDQTDAIVSEVESKLEQTASSFEIQFNQFSQDIEAVAAGADAEFEEIRKYIRFEDGKILLGEVGNELELEIANDRISFLQDGAEVAYFSNRKLYVTDAEILHSLQLGSFAFMPRTNGNLSFKKTT